MSPALLRTHLFYGWDAAIVVPDGVDAIGSRAFADCPNLELVWISNEMILPEDAFEGCAHEVTVLSR